MSEVKVNKISPRSGTSLTIGDSGDTTNIVGTLQNNGAVLVGDISSVVAGTNLSGGGTSGDVTINLADASTSAKGAASFSSDNFAASSGAITVKDAGIATAELQDNAVTTAKITDANVTTAKIADANVTTAKIADDAITLAKMAPGTDGNLITYDASGNPAAVATGSAGQILTSAGAGAPPTFATAAAAGKILGIKHDWSAPSENTTSSSYVDIPSNKGRISYTTVGANSNFIISYMTNWKQTGNHPNYLYFGNVRYLIELQSDLSVLATGNSRGYMININEGTLITDNGSTTQNDYLDPGTLAAGTDIYFQPQFSSQATLTVNGLQVVIWEIAA